MIATDQALTDHPSSVELILLRVGLNGHVGRFRVDEGGNWKRGERTVCRTARGLEMGVVLGSAVVLESGASVADGKLLRRMTPEDELLWGHLRQLGEEARLACVTWLEQLQLEAVLLEVEPLLDGRTLYFHFLSDVDEQVQQQLDRLVELYEQQVRQSKFANLLKHGCGPGCGTSQAKNGCGSRGGCAVCKVAGACAAPKPTASA